MKKTMVFLVMAAVFTPLLAQTAAAPADESAATRLAAGKIDKGQLTSNLESLGKLLESSSAAKQIAASKSPAATSRREKAVEIHAAAKAALEGGDLANASKLMSEARMVFFEGVRLASPGEVSAKKLENDYNTRLESVNALLSAYNRVAAEKGGIKDVDKTVALVEASKSKAANLAQGAKFKEAREELDRGYLVAKTAVSNLRSGDTLVRSLNFASKEEEYHYEVDRNDTHQMMLKAFVSDEKRANPTIQDFVAKGQGFRTQADAAAKGKDYAEAVKLLEQSTSELIRAIRNAGIYIPG